MFVCPLIHVIVKSSNPCAAKLSMRVLMQVNNTLMDGSHGWMMGSLDPSAPHLGPPTSTSTRPFMGKAPSSQS